METMSLFAIEFVCTHFCLCNSHLGDVSLIINLVIRHCALLNSFDLGWGIKDEIHAYINTQAAPDPDSAIKGRLLTVAEGCGLPVTVKKARVKRVVGGDAATNGKSNH